MPTTMQKQLELWVLTEARHIVVDDVDALNEFKTMLVVGKQLSRPQDEILQRAITAWLFKVIKPKGCDTVKAYIEKFGSD